MTVTARVKGQMSVRVRADSYRGKVIADAELSGGSQGIPLNCGIIGKRAIYFEFYGDGEAEFESFTFDK